MANETVRNRYIWLGLIGLVPLGWNFVAFATEPVHEDHPSSENSTVFELDARWIATPPFANPLFTDISPSNQERSGAISPPLEPDIFQTLFETAKPLPQKSRSEQQTNDYPALSISLHAQSSHTMATGNPSNWEGAWPITETSLNRDNLLFSNVHTETTAQTPLEEVDDPPEEDWIPLTPADRSSAYVQAAYLQQGDDISARLRGSGIYVFSPSVFAGATVDLTTGEALSDSGQTGLNLHELYVTASPANVPNLRFTVGLMDLTSYFDRNSFAKDAVTQFFNPVFQTNPALSAVNIASRPGALVNWTPNDNLSLTASTFSSEKGLGNFSLDSFAAELGVRWENAILRGTYVSSRDGGVGNGFQEISTLPRSDGTFGTLPGDREEGFGLNGEYFIPSLNLGLFGRVGWYTNTDLNQSGTTYSFGVNALDLFLPDDRLGIAYGRQLSNNDLRQINDLPVPDVLELFYDLRLSPNFRAGVTIQQRNNLSDTYLGFRVRFDQRWTNIGRVFE